ncbi:MAG TPA: aldehyde dehydrogenase family protein, partial [Candidatus Thioglobus sp.]|nr:aldehyde dehydrogenase family protein [Candidatus Thioglobus sp.]
MNKKSNYIFGEYTTPLGRVSSYVKQHNGELIKVKFQESEKKDLDRALNKSINNRKLWGSLNRTDRLSMFDSIIKTLEKNKDALVKFESEYSGKSTDDAFNEINIGVDHWRMARSALECLHDNYYQNVCKTHKIEVLTQRRVSDIIQEFDMLGIINGLWLCSFTNNSNLLTKGTAKAIHCNR